MSKPTIAITGSTGLIGSRIIELLSDRFDFIPLRAETGFDITNKNIVNSQLSTLGFDFLLHLAAYTHVDKAEIERELCHKINVDGTKNLLDMCETKGAKMILISTDFVFDGKPIEEIPSSKFQVPSNSQFSMVNSLLPRYTETAIPHPLGYYASTKYEAEQLVADTGMIVRITTPYRAEFPGKKDIIRTIKSLLEEGKSLMMVSDNLVVPTYIDDIALALGYLIEHYTPEIYHAVGPAALSSYDLAMQIAKRWDLNVKLISPSTHTIYGAGKAPRPQYGNIVNTKDLGTPMRSLHECLQLL